MVNLISQNGYFFREVPFTNANAEAIRTKTGHGFALYETGQQAHFLATDINNAAYPIALVKVEKAYPHEENVKKCSSEGIDEDGMKIKLFVETSIKTYENFRPTIYQPCLISVNEREWRIAVCRGYDAKDNQPRFFGYIKTYKSVPLCNETEPLLNAKDISWKDFVPQQIEQDETEKPTEVPKE